MLRAIALRLRLQPPAALAGSFSDRTSRDLLGQIVDELRKDRTLLVLDGVDRLWHEKEPDAETWLAKLYESAADSNFAMVAVLTGYRRPLKVPWGLRIDLTPLSDEDSSRLFIEVAKEKEMERNLPALSESDALRSLIKTLDGIPLAIKIMACTAALTVHKEGGTRADWESVLGKLRREWQAERDSFREKEESLPEQQKPLAIQPLFSLWVSLQVGLARDERAKQSLALMGLLPEGMHENDLAVLRQRFPDILGKIDDLKRRDIVFEEDNRVRLEPPILEYAQRQLTPEPQHKEVIANYYLDKAITGQAIGWGQPVGGDATAAVIEGLTAEANNIEAFIREELKHGDRPRGIRSALALGRFFRFSGAAGDHRILKEALTASKPDGDDEIELRAECFRVLGGAVSKRWCARRSIASAARRTDGDRSGARSRSSTCRCAQPLPPSSVPDSPHRR